MPKLATLSFQFLCNRLLYSLYVLILINSNLLTSSAFVIILVSNILFIIHKEP